MAAPALSTPFQPYVYQSPQSAVTPFQIFGVDAQIVQIMLKPHEKIVSKTGSLCYMSSSIQAEVQLPPENVVQWVIGKPEPITTYSNTGTEDGYIAFSATNLARILPIDLAAFGGELICQRDAFLCSVDDVTIKMLAPQRDRTGYFSVEVLATQKLSGQGLAFILAGGAVVQKKLNRGEVIVVDISCVVAMTASVVCDIKQTNGARRTLFGADGQSQAHLTGPGVVFIQSLPPQKLVQTIARRLTAPHFRDNPRLLFSAGVFLFIAYAIIISSLLLSEV